MTHPAILILAAGASSRMAPRDKLLELVGDEPLLRRQTRLACETGCPTFVALSPYRAKALEGLNYTPIVIEDPSQGMAASLRAGLAEARKISPPALMILPGDMPDFTLPALVAILDGWQETPNKILRGQAENGQPGHPAIFPADLFDELAQMQGDQGGRTVLQAHPDRIRLFPLPGAMAITDLDTPEDWAAFRART
ncbi:nucleotidyltransferase family protein [Neogemmobacter tilapiae]|uniref:Molybdopterin-guanine dinucleotide biosynthesis protein A n=1 Tax=Neogemmobacter tilapiae TaxID=875041 RepID=A0A918TFE9_9RHOB|nr:nucleotidyltransferase family protein [Gemmobacter tilapiae]GHC45310.1 molybdopterin-guanine dinucleotide biosynthesis protein A [Gemmobacter tilapiae]